MGFQAVDEDDDGGGGPVGGGDVFGDHATVGGVEEGGGELVELHAGWDVVVLGYVKGEVEVIATGVGRTAAGESMRETIRNSTVGSLR